jgi:putative Ca2+/H+ antiporter (TMEM165/GDT1 family)
MISTWILSLFFTTLPQIFLDCLIAALFFWTSYELFQIQSYTQSFKNTNSDTVKKTFLWTFALFLVAEMGDKTQFLGASLATASQTPWLVILGSSCGITLANLPIVFFGQNIIQRFRQSLICKTAGFTFALMGLWYTAKVVGN